MFDIQKLKQETLLTLDPSGLSPAQIGWLSPAQIGWLSPAQICGLSRAQIRWLSRAQLGVLSRAQIGGLSRAQIGGLSPAQIGWLSPAQIGWLSPAQICGLSRAQIRWLSPAQIGELSPAQICGLSRDQIGVLSPAQICGLSPDQAAAIFGDASVPKVEKLYSKMLAGIRDAKRKLDQSTFGPDEDAGENLCDTPMCIAGHTVNLAGAAGYALKDRFSFEAAARLIHRASCPDTPEPLYGNYPSAWALSYIEEMARLEDESA